MKFFSRILSTVLAASLLMGSIAVDTVMVSAAPSVSGGWYETLYAEWADSDPDSATVEYKLHSDAAYTMLKGDDAKYLIRPASTSGYGRVDIPGLKAGRYDIKITTKSGAVHTRENIEVLPNDRSGYAHWNRVPTERAYDGVGAYKDDGTLKDNAIVIYLTDENKDTVTIPGYEDKVWDYAPSSGSPYSRTSEGIGNILNNNYKFIDEVTRTHPLVIRLIGKVTAPKNLTPYNVKDPILGGAKGDGGYLAVMKWGRNITIEGIGEDAEMYGWGFTVSKTDSHPADSGQSVEVRNITFRNYVEDGLGFQGEGDALVERIWVHNNTFYPGDGTAGGTQSPAESDKGEGDGSCDFKRGQYYTMDYNHYINCHKTNLLGPKSGDSQYYMTLHHNWYENVASRQPLAGNGNVHVYSTYFQNGKVTVDTRYKNATFLEENYYENCNERFSSRTDTCYAKSYNEMETGSGKIDLKGIYKQVNDRTESVIGDTTFKFPDGTAMTDFDMNPNYFYYDTVNKKTIADITPAAQVKEVVTKYAGVQHYIPAEEAGYINITVQDETGAPVKDASVTASGLSFSNDYSGTYTARAEIGAEYVITVSKEGYSNKSVTPDIITEDGQERSITVKLEKDYDGYAVVNLTGGSDNAPVIDASITLNNGTSLVGQGDGTYKSAVEIPTGEYKATITNTGDYIVPAEAPSVFVKTTNAATEIHLEKAKGKVSVTIVAADGSEKTLDASAAVVYVGNTLLKYDAASGTFTGEVDINTPFVVTASLGGWKMLSVDPETLTVSKTGVTPVTVTMQEGGEEFIWNHTDGTNTDDFFTFVDGGDWGDAKKNIMEYDGNELSKAVKFNSSKFFSFNAPADGEIIIIAHNRNKAATLSFNGGTPVDVAIGVNGPYPVKAGENKVARASGEPCIYYVKYTMTGAAVTPGPGGDTTSTTTTTEAQPEATTYSIPVELGTPTNNNGAVDGGTATVTYDEATDTWHLSDTSSTAAAELIIPFKEAVTKGKVIITGKVTPSTDNGKWGFLRVTGTVDGLENQDVAAFASGLNNEIALRTGSVDDATSPNNYVYTPASPTVAVKGGNTYDYVIVIDMDAKTATLKVNGVTGEITHAINADAITGVGSITAKKDIKRQVTLTTPYVGIPTDAPEEGLNDEIMWDVSKEHAAGVENGLTFSETFYAEKDDNVREFKDGNKTYEMVNYLQATHNPTAADGKNPMNSGNTGIPVNGGYLKYTAEKNGVFTFAVKTTGSKFTYVNDETGKNIIKIGSEDQNFDIVRFNAEAGKSYYIFAGGSNMCLFYLGFTSGISVDDPAKDTTTTTEASTQGTTTTVTETSTQGTTAKPPTPAGDEVYGNADGSSDGVKIPDVVNLFGYVLGNAIEQTDGGVIDSDNIESSGWMKWLDVHQDGKIDSADVAEVLQKVLNSNYQMDVERKLAQ